MQQAPELTDRANFIRAFHRAGKLAHADEGTLREARLLGRCRPAPRPREHRARRRRVTVGRNRTSASSRGDPDEPDPPLGGSRAALTGGLR
jgi:hypothetical protein